MMRPLRKNQLKKKPNKEEMTNVLVVQEKNIKIAVAEDSYSACFYFNL